jgi:hypothetical protein
MKQMTNPLSRVYEATSAARELETLFQESIETNGDVTHLEQHIDALALKADSLPDAVDDLLCVIKEVEIRAEARRAEAERLKQRAKRDEAVAGWFRTQILRVMQSQGKTKMETKHWRLSVAMPGGKPAMELVDVVPDNFQMEETVICPDKEAIRSALERGEVLTFARLVPKEPYLRIS